ncbi:hypothetical protein QTQ03_21290 [Micromonospora sp. WMMA1363]|uniref:hypothetical protein n=1 Tax=Micromonospora sp. WMMA1363 TaxID=3053985 RepID=UPI00259D1E7C|nr:hypothetical protein [Micromonospora sp. WMMA1363]MDM4721998.1 hypothetical protein [Micromonospora sp. WMMA1363]
MAGAGHRGGVMNGAVGQAPALLRYRAFLGAVFAPGVHVAYGVLWACAYEAAAVTAAGGAWRPSTGSLVRATTIIVVLLYLRLADERMDESYDRVHNPTRPLVTGLVSVIELRRAGWAAAALAIVVNVPLAPWSAVTVAVLVGYTELLTRLTLRLPRLRDRALLYIVVAYPVQLLIGVYLYMSVTGTALVRPGAHPVLLIIVFAAAFLHYEFARKTVRDPHPGARTYSATALGATGSGVLTLGWALLACALLTAITEPWHVSVTALLPYVALVFPIAGAFSYLRGRERKWPTSLAMLYVIVLDATLVTGGLLG